MTGALKCFSRLEKHFAKIASDFLKNIFYAAKKIFFKSSHSLREFFQEKIALHHHILPAWDSSAYTAPFTYKVGMNNSFLIFQLVNIMQESTKKCNNK